jgi:single-strand DNA-binding protein
MNKCIITGRITKDLELRQTSGDFKVCEFTIATNRPTAKDEETKADFVKCVVWNKQAENLCKYQGKGSLIAVLGKYTNDIYEVNGEKRYKDYILVSEIEYLDSKKEFKDLSIKTEVREDIINEEDMPF